MVTMKLNKNNVSTIIRNHTPFTREKDGVRAISFKYSKKTAKLFFALILLSSFFLISCNKGETNMQTDTLVQAPGFVLMDENSMEHKLSDYSEQFVLIYFYPKDDTPGCTTEACAIRDSFEGFQQRNIKVFGISTDNPESHKKFKDKYHLPFTLLADENQEVAKIYHADGMFLKRISYLIAPGGQIIKHYSNVSPSTHAREILEDFDKINH
ncbi:MAG: peroxiredoxin [Proteobacteria bacterium]|nr:peroxiredoxin [Pseudomonadota bacterium]